MAAVHFLSGVVGSVGRVIDIDDSELVSLLALSSEGADRTGADEAEVVRVLGEVARMQARLEAVRLRFVGRLSAALTGDTAAAAVVARVERTSMAKAVGDVALARMLVSRLPVTQAELAAGRLPAERVRQIARATAVLTRSQCVEAEAMLHPGAGVKGPRQLRDRLRVVLGAVDPAGERERAVRRGDRRAVSVERRLDALTREIVSGGEVLARYRARTGLLSEVLSGAEARAEAGSGGGVRVLVACNATTLLGLDDLGGSVQGIGPVSAEWVRDLAGVAGAVWSGVVVGEDGGVRLVGAGSRAAELVVGWRQCHGAARAAARYSWGGNGSVSGSGGMGVDRRSARQRKKRRKTTNHHQR